jgi:chemotaxis protein CheD
MRIDVGIGDMKSTNSYGQMLKTYALGSCVAVTLYDIKSKTTGMIHIALPDSTINPEKAKLKPGYFADTGIPSLLAIMRKRGWKGNKLIVKMAGGASIMDENNHFDIGRRNIVSAKRILWKNGLGVLKEDIGGHKSRTVSIEVDTGEVIISNCKSKWTL